MSLNIFLIYTIYSLCCLCIDFYDISAWSGCWFDVYIRRFIYKFLNVCPFDYMAVGGSGKVGPVNQVNHTSWVAVATPTDRPKSVRNRCLIELFVALFVLSLCPFDISMSVGAFVIGLSQISSFLSSYLSHPGIWSSLHVEVNIDLQAALFLCFSWKQNIESTEECSNSIARKNNDKFGKRIGLNKSQMGRDQVSGGVSVPCCYGTPIVNVLWKPLRIQRKVESGKKVTGWYKVWSMGGGVVIVFG